MNPLYVSPETLCSGISRAEIDTTYQFPVGLFAKTFYEELALMIGLANEGQVALGTDVPVDDMISPSMMGDDVEGSVSVNKVRKNITKWYVSVTKKDVVRIGQLLVNGLLEWATGKFASRMEGAFNLMIHSLHYENPKTWKV